MQLRITLATQHIIMLGGIEEVDDRMFSVCAVVLRFNMTGIYDITVDEVVNRKLERVTDRETLTKVRDRVWDVCKDTLAGVVA